MTCRPEGTHHMACDCREAQMAADLALVTAERDELRQIVAICVADPEGVRKMRAVLEAARTHVNASWAPTDPEDKARFVALFKAVARLSR